MERKNLVWGGVVKGYDIFALIELYRQKKSLIYIVNTDLEIKQTADILKFIQPDIEVFTLMGWDSGPYDSVSVHSDVESDRISALCQMALNPNNGIVITSVNAFLMRLPPMDFFKKRFVKIEKKQNLNLDEFIKFLLACGYIKTSTVDGVGQFALRGGIIDIFPTGQTAPVRIDLFGDEIEEIKYFDTTTQRSTGNVDEVLIYPAAEYSFDELELFCQKYKQFFDYRVDDLVYEKICQKIIPPAIENFIPLFHEEMKTLIDYRPNATLVLRDDVFIQIDERISEIADAYQSRLKDGSDIYRPLPVPELYLTQNESQNILEKAIVFSSFASPKNPDKKSRVLTDFCSSKNDIHVQLEKYIRQKNGQVILSFSDKTTLFRICGLLKDMGIPIHVAHSFDEAINHMPSAIIASFENGFSSLDFNLITQHEMEGVVKKVPAPSRRENFIEDVSSLNIGDLIVHLSHGIGEFQGLETVSISGQKVDCLKILYADKDVLFVPVNNLDLLTRYGENNGTKLDKLGSSLWQSRREKVKKNLFEMAQKLIDIEAKRKSITVEKILPPLGLYADFCARFPYVETPDQEKTMDDILSDFESAHPMDRLVCGDVGFGKTEMALRAAFLVASSGYQVALIAPTTLLARQHFELFKKRFDGFGFRIAQLSRLVSSKDQKLIQSEIKSGMVDIVIGTHALLSKNISFNRLGLVIVDEEQHFGVAHKERLKEISQGVHVLTLTATPIPRTLQLSLTGVRELSIIATPPLSRLEVGTFVMPFDRVRIAQIIRREVERGGQVFYVCPRISDMPDLMQVLNEVIPDIRIVQAHGRMSGSELEKIMLDFSEGKSQVLLATSIIESGLDMPNVNTIIVHKAHLFGLAALYQLKGRVGRSSLKAYAYLTTPFGLKLSPSAYQRLSVMQSLEKLGSGFTLASHDLDIRGAGNLLGKEQSGHIQEVGVELFQKMLVDAVYKLKNQETDMMEFSPTISIGVSVMIPDDYINDLNVRLSFYHRLASVKKEQELEEIYEEMIDRFGSVPAMVNDLIEVMKIKMICQTLMIDKCDAGEKGMVITFWKNKCPNPAGLVMFLNSQLGLARLTTTHQVVISRSWPNEKDRLIGVQKVLEKLHEALMPSKTIN